MITLYKLKNTNPTSCPSPSTFSSDGNRYTSCPYGRPRRSWGGLFSNLRKWLTEYNFLSYIGWCKRYMNKDIFYLNWALRFSGIQCACCYTGSGTCLLKYKVGIIFLASAALWNKKFQNKVIQPSEAVCGSIAGGIDDRDGWFSTVASS